MPLTTVKGAVWDSSTVLEDTTAAAFRATIEADRVVQTKTGTYAQLATDVNNLIRFTSAGNYNLLPVSTAGGDFHVTLFADGGDITIDPDSAEQVNGGATVVVPDGSYAELFCSGADWFCLVGRGTSAYAATLLDDANAAEARTTLGLAALAEKATIDSAALLDDDVVSLAKQAHQTEGDILYYAASGVPTALSKGTDGQVLSLTSGLPSWENRKVLESEVSTTSGTNVNLTSSIPDWATRVTLMIEGLSTSGTAAILVQMGGPGAFEASNYSGAITEITGSGANASANSAGFAITYNSRASDYFTGKVELTLKDATNNTWVSRSSGNYTTELYEHIGTGAKTINGNLLRLQLTTFGGTNTFTDGTVAVMYE